VLEAASLCTWALFTFVTLRQVTSTYICRTDKPTSFGVIDPVVALTGSGPPPLRPVRDLAILLGCDPEAGPSVEPRAWMDAHVLLQELLLLQGGEGAQVSQ
jgi:hypothetical protein